MAHGKKRKAAGSPAKKKKKYKRRPLSPLPSLAPIAFAEFDPSEPLEEGEIRSPPSPTPQAHSNDPDNVFGDQPSGGAVDQSGESELPDDGDLDAAAYLEIHDRLAEELDAPEFRDVAELEPFLQSLRDERVSAWEEYQRDCKK